MTSKTVNKLKPRSLTIAILEVIGLGLLAGNSNPLRPILPIMVKEIIKLIKEHHQWEIEEQKIKRTLRLLEKRELLGLEEKNGEAIVYIKDQNNPLILKYSVKPLLDMKMKEKKWNGKWFMVFFDVPEIQRNKRDYLRYYLDRLGFYRYQKSVYIFPYDCEKEISLIKKVVEGGKYMKYIIAEKIEDEEIVKTFFHLN